MADKILAPAPVKVTLTAKGKTFTPRPGTHRHAAWTILVANAGKAEVEVVAAINHAGAGSITGRNLLGWSRKAGLIT